MLNEKYSIWKWRLFFKWRIYDMEILCFKKKNKVVCMEEVKKDENVGYIGFLVYGVRWLVLLYGIKDYG